MAALLPVMNRHPVVAFVGIGLGAYFLTAAIQPIVNAQVLPFDLPLHGVLGGVLGVGVGAFLVTGALAGRDGIRPNKRPASQSHQCCRRWSIVVPQRCPFRLSVKSPQLTP